MSYRARLNRKLLGAARIRLHSPELIEADRLEMIRAKAAAYVANHPRPRAVFS